MTSQGFITLDRKLLDWGWYDDSMTVHLWIHLLLCANHEEKRWHGIQIQRGQLVTSIQSISEFTGMSARNIRTRLTRLVECQCITVQPTNKYSLITICNYDSYQSQDVVKRQTDDTQVTNKRQTNDNQTTTNNNDNNNISSITITREAKIFNLYDVVSKENIPVLTDTWIEEISMLCYRQLRIKLTPEQIKEHYQNFIVQEVTEVTQVTYKEFREHFNSYVRCREQIKQQEKNNGNSTTNKAGYDRLRAAEVRAVSPKDYETTF